MDGFKQVLDRLNEWFAKFSFNQKVLLGALAAAAVLSVVIFSAWLRTDEKAVLFTNLTPEDASLALDELAKMDVPADLSNGGTTILVPEGDVHRMRVELASRGIPSSGVVGFEIFDGKQYGLTEFLQNVNFKRALEGELTKSIESLSGIRAARVHLVLPKPSIFKKLQNEATASVVVTLGRQARLADSQIQGIQSLVAGSVEGLDADKVTVIDQNGKVLSPTYGDEGVGRSESQLALKKEVEGYLTAKAEGMLGEVLGQGKSIVRVDATLNFERIEREKETFDPEGSVVRSEEVDESSDPQGGGSQSTSVTNYEINRTVERIAGQTGGIKNLSVAVFVDGRYEAPAGGGDPAYSPLSEDELGQIQRVVTTAVGLDQQRGDRIEVVNMQFNGGPEPAAVGGGAAPGWLGLVAQYGGRAVLIAAAVFMLLSLRRSLGHLVGQGLASGSRRGGVRPAAEQERLDMQGLAETADTMAQDIRAYAAENPEKVAEVLQSWITDDAGEMV